MGGMGLVVRTFVMPVYAVVSAIAESGESPAQLGDNTGGTALQSDSADIWALLLKTIFSLILIIGIFIVLMKILAQKNRQWTRGRAVRTIAGAPLGPNKSVQLVAIGRSLYVIGVGDNVQLIHKIDDPEEVAYITETLSGAVPSGQGRIGQWWERIRSFRASVPEDEPDITASFQQLLHDKMRNVADRNRMIEQTLRQTQYADRSSEP